MVTKRGGIIVKEFSDDVDYVLCVNTHSKNGLPLNLNRQVNWVDIRWVDECIQSKSLLAANRIICPNKERSTVHLEADESNDLPKSNDSLISELVNRMNYHKLKKDKFKVLAYRRAIQSITDSNQIIHSGSQALKLPHVGKSIAEKIDQILKSGKLSIPPATEIDTVVELFKGIYGVGDSIAMNWYNKGWRSLEDVQNHAQELTHDQKLGLKYYTEINSKISREEMMQLQIIVEEIVKKIDKDYAVYLVGSFRRGQSECGDADFLVTHPNPELSTDHSIGLILKVLQENGIEIVHLTNMSTDHNFYKGLCKLNKPDAKFRRIDILMVPIEELGASLIYFTGNDLFNRRIRNLAKSKGMKLNQHGLYTVEPDGSAILIASKTEMDIFNVLGLPWKDPNDRIL